MMMSGTRVGGVDSSKNQSVNIKQFLLILILIMLDVKSSSSGVSDSPDAKRLQVREKLWEEPDQAGGGSPGLQV